MIEIAIVGGGLCGLTLAWRLRSQDRRFALFEARDRLGGRILTVDQPIAADLGACWFWPDTQPHMKQLLAELGLSSFPQHDQGDVLLLRDPDDGPETASSDPVHGGAHRVRGGMGRVIDSLVSHIDPDQLHLGHVLIAVRQKADHVELDFQTAHGLTTHPVRRVVLALPPRLLAENVRFDPTLDIGIQDAMSETETWMANRAKVVVGYDRASWRDAGRSGSAFVTHDSAVLAEVFDACEPTAALGGFLALSPDMREFFSAGLPLLIGSQIAGLFGAGLENGEQYYLDWAAERFTCGTLDREADHRRHSGLANPLLRRSVWHGKLLLAGAETAGRGAGLLEGALEAASRATDALQPDSLPSIKDSIARFQAWVMSQRDPVLDSYRRRLDRGLAIRRTAPVTRDAILGAIEEIYSNALGVLYDLPFDTEHVAVERGRSSLTPLVQEPFRSFIQGFLDDVTAFNRTSHILADFPDEQTLSQEYMQSILRQVADAWRSFSLTANRLLLAKAAIPRTG